MTGFNAQGTVHQLLDDADRALKSAEFILTDSRRPDLSYVEYLRACEIVVEIIPCSKGWPDLQTNYRGNKLRKYKVLLRKVNSLAEQYANIKMIIVNNNKRMMVE
jgi:ubiquitin carboxyl-terminal hydrolase 8